LLEQLTRHAHDVDVYVVSHELDDETARPDGFNSLLFGEASRQKQGHGYLAACWPAC
jgi:two-component system sensor histidine kinase KdpD